MPLSIIYLSLSSADKWTFLQCHWHLKQVCVCVNILFCPSWVIFWQQDENMHCLLITLKSQRNIKCNVWHNSLISIDNQWNDCQVKSSHPFSSSLCHTVCRNCSNCSVCAHPSCIFHWVFIVYKSCGPGHTLLSWRSWSLEHKKSERTEWSACKIMATYLDGSKSQWLANQYDNFNISKTVMLVMAMALIWSLISLSMARLCVESETWWIMQCMSSCGQHMDGHGNCSDHDNLYDSPKFHIIKFTMFIKILIFQCVPF